MLRACDEPFVGYEVVPKAAEDLQVIFPDSDEQPASGKANGETAHDDDKGDVML